MCKLVSKKSSCGPDLDMRWTHILKEESIKLDELRIKLEKISYQVGDRDFVCRLDLNIH